MDAKWAALAAAAPSPAGALRCLERLVAVLPGTNLTDDAFEVAGLICGKAPYLASLCQRDPTRLGRVASDPYLRQEKPHPVFKSELRARLANGATEESEFHSVLRNFRADEMTRLGARELSLGTPVEVGRELSYLAEVCLDAAITRGRDQLNATMGRALVEDTDTDVAFVVLGMGKLGGLELNFASDIDLIYAYETDRGHAGERSIHEYMTALGRFVTKALADVTDDGRVFRVDLRLRPEGSRGAMANSVVSLERYYETFGRPWERQAWLKARPCAGDLKLGDAILDMLSPFVYPRSTSPAIVEQVAALNQRIKIELDTTTGVERGFDVKNGVGGIREVEFFVQTLQLLYAGKNPSVRSRNTSIALDQLCFAGLISDTEREQLHGCYWQLRHLEHILQMQSGRQTQRLPRVDEDDYELVAGCAGFDSGSELTAALKNHTSSVQHLFASLADPNEPEQPQEITELLAARASPQREALLLARLGFNHALKAAHLLEVVRNKPHSPLSPSASGAARRVAPALLKEIASCPDPLQALRLLGELVARRDSRAFVWPLMDQRPELARLVCSLFGTSEFLSKQLLASPDLAALLLDPSRSALTLTIDELAAEYASQIATDHRRADNSDPEVVWNTLATFKASEVVRVALGDIGGHLSCGEVCVELSRIAEVCARTAFAVVESQVANRHGIARLDNGAPSTMAVFALGKLGGRELGYASDLDLVFVYQGAGRSDGARAIDNLTHSTRTAQRLVGALHAHHPGGRLYEVDTRLRPSGSSGHLVSSLKAWKRYHATSARTWERQALTKLRFLAGDPLLGDTVQAEVREFVYQSATEPAEIATSIDAMRRRIEAELGNSVHGYDIKTGPGGIVDIEFAGQFLQLAYGREQASLQTTSTTEALAAAADAALIEANDAQTLIDGYWFLRSVEHKMRIVHNRPVHKLPTSGPELDKLARRLGHPNGSSLASQYTHWTSTIRRAYRKVVLAV